MAHEFKDWFDEYELLPESEADLCSWNDEDVAFIKNDVHDGKSMWLIYAAGLTYLMMAVVIIALGIPVYMWARKQNAPDQKAFTTGELWLAAALVVIALWAIYAFSRGIVTLG